jgi:hypothetical protein
VKAFLRRCALAASLLLTLGGAQAALAGDVTPAGSKLAQFYDSLHVESHWIAGTHVDWESGDPDGASENLPGRHTHCSAFVASTAKKLGVYILRPPEHG